MILIKMLIQWWLILNGANNSFEDTSISKTLTPGYYICYAYHDIPHSTKKDETHYFVKFDSNSKSKINKK